MNTRHHRLLLDCYLSGQVSAAQWTEHLKDPDFAKFFASEMGVAKPVTVAEVTAAQNGDTMTLGVRARAFETWGRTKDGSLTEDAEQAFKAGWNAHKGNVT